MTRLKVAKASPFDRIWGVGYGAVNAERNRGDWGENLLGKALMRVRHRVRAERSSEVGVDGKEKS